MFDDTEQAAVHFGLSFENREHSTIAVYVQIKVKAKCPKCGWAMPFYTFKRMDTTMLNKSAAYRI